jgi:hypothetical protein
MARLLSSINLLTTIENVALGSSVVFPAGHVIQMVTATSSTNITTTAPHTTTRWELDANDLHITVTVGNKVVCWICGGSYNHENATQTYETWMRFSENSAGNNQDKFVASALGGDFTPDLYMPGTTVTGVVTAAYTGEMLIKGGRRKSADTADAPWYAGGAHGDRTYVAMEIQG